MKFAMVLVLLTAAGSHANHFPPRPVGVTTLKSEKTAGVSISYKEVRFFWSAELLS